MENAYFRNFKIQNKDEDIVKLFYFPVHLCSDVFPLFLHQG